LLPAEVEEYLGVAGRSEVATAPHWGGPEFTIVVDLPVEDNN